VSHCAEGPAGRSSRTVVPRARPAADFLVRFHDQPHIFNLPGRRVRVVRWIKIVDQFTTRKNIFALESTTYATPPTGR
jgi:hypothetical protein